MSHDRDGEDAKVLARGDFARLLAKYEPTIIARCVAALHGHVDADDVAQDVKVRLFREFSVGKTYPVPFRVVVNMVTGWTIKEYFAGRPTDVPLPENWERADPDDAYGELFDRDAVSTQLGKLRQGKTRQVMELFYLDHLDVAGIAEQLDMKPNAVHQALHNGHTNLRKILTGG